MFRDHRLGYPTVLFSSGILTPALHAVHVPRIQDPEEAKRQRAFDQLVSEVLDWIFNGKQESPTGGLKHGRVCVASGKHGAVRFLLPALTEDLTGGCIDMLAAAVQNMLDVYPPSIHDGHTVSAEDYRQFYTDEGHPFEWGTTIEWLSPDGTYTLNGKKRTPKAKSSVVAVAEAPGKKPGRKVASQPELSAPYLPGSGFEPIRDFIKKVIATVGRETVISALGYFGIERPGQLRPEDYNEFVERCMVGIFSEDSNVPLSVTEELLGSSSPLYSFYMHPELREFRIDVTEFKDEAPPESGWYLANQVVWRGEVLVAASPNNTGKFMKFFHSDVQKWSTSVPVYLAERNVAKSAAMKRRARSDARIGWLRKATLEEIIGL